MIRSLLAALFVCATLFVGLPLPAQDAKPPDPEAARLASKVSYEIYSPFCPGKTLAMCPSAAAAEVRRDIQDMAEAGMNEDQIKQSILDEYGEEFRVVEPGLADNIGPLGLFGGGLVIAIIVVFAISRRRSGGKGERESDVEPEKEEPRDPYTEALRDEYRD